MKDIGGPKEIVQGPLLALEPYIAHTWSKGTNEANVTIRMYVKMLYIELYLAKITIFACKIYL